MVFVVLKIEHEGNNPEFGDTYLGINSTSGVFHKEISSKISKNLFRMLTTYENQMNFT